MHAQSSAKSQRKAQRKAAHLAAAQAPTAPKPPLAPAQPLLQRLRALLIIFTVVFIAFGPAVTYNFLEHDDDQNITHNPRLQTITSDGLKAFWTSSYLGLYIPVTYSYWAGGVALSHLVEPASEVPFAQPGLFHFGNLVLHGLNGWFVYLLLRRFGCKAQAALAGGLLFVLHPIQVEPVAWVTGGKDLLSTCLALGSLLAYASSLGIGLKPRRYRLHPYAAYALALVLFVAAILAKPSTVILPALLCMQELYAARRLRWQAVLRVAPYFAAVGLLLVSTGATQITEGPFPPVPFWLRPLVAGDSMLFYLRQILFPLRFAVDYGRRPDVLLNDQVRLTIAVAPYIAGCLLLWQAFKGRFLVLTAAAAIFAAALLPTLGFRQFAYQFFSTVCDRYAYLSILGVALLAACYLDRKDQKRLYNAAWIVLAALGGLSLRQTTTWKDEAALFGHSVEVAPEGAVALVALSNDTANHGNWAGTIPLLERASTALPQWGRPYNNLGTTYLNLGKNDLSVEKYRMALHYFPNYPLAHSNLCAALAGLARYAEAEPECREALRLSPEFDMPYLNLGYIYSKQDNPMAALEAFEHATQLSPGTYKPRRNLGIILRKLGRHEQAAAHLELLRQDYPRDLGLILDLGDSYAAQGKKEQARAVYDGFLALVQEKDAVAAVQQALARLQQ